MLEKEGANLPFPPELAHGQVHYNRGLKADDNTSIIPDLSFVFVANNDSPDPICPVICQITFNTGFEAAQKEVQSLAKANPSIIMAIIVAIHEVPASYHSTSSFNNTFTPEPLTTGGHTWYSIKTVSYHIWLKDFDGQLNVDADAGDHYASYISPGNEGCEKVEALFVLGLTEVKKSIVSFCKAIICEMDSPPDLTPLISHKTALPISMKSFDGDILRGIKLTGYYRYDSWFTKEFHKGKCHHVEEEQTMRRPRRV
ncbi:hypothetical protein JVT61DRAFT_13700 [Boletus reticuloceps]|uniref:Uncharacterized protein n=1 Tax=Boletus reticuloceps TaxID=495285 RepID=A0A8I3AD01_9AGAM|nr:hypothetical protein JVT61DRAFT_13700 [Boletus reticuloceps]